MLFFQIILALYGLFLFILVIAYFKKGPREIIQSDESIELTLSVIIPVRDEDELNLLLDDLSSQNFPRENLEVIVVDDHSQLTPVCPTEIKLIKLEGQQAGKKAALTKGIKAARGEIIITIDGDCRVGPDFLNSINNAFNERDTVLSPGLVAYFPVKNFFEKMQATELYAIMGTGLALNSLGLTSLSNGANLAFRKSVWDEVGGYSSHDHIPSGDDEFFVQDVVKKHKDKVIFRYDAGSLVSTPPNRSFTEFFNQRIRWAGKWKSYHDIKMSMIAAMIFLFHIGICGALIMLFNSWNEYLLLLFGLKMMLEGVLIYKVSQDISKQFYILTFLLLQFLYSPYVVLFGLTANFVTYNWKGRKFRY